MNGESSKIAETSEDDICFKHAQLRTGPDQELYRSVATASRSPSILTSYAPPVKFPDFNNKQRPPVAEAKFDLSSAGAFFSFDKNLLSAPKLNVHLDAPEKNCSFLVPAKQFSSNEGPLFSLATIVCRTLQESSCDFDVNEQKCKWKGVCHGHSSFFAFTVQIYSATMKSCGSRRHVVVVRRLSGESIPFRQLYGSLKAAICGVACPTIKQLSFQMCGSGSTWTDGSSIEKEISLLCEMVESNYLDQQIFALKALSKLVQSDEAARLIVASNSQFMKSLLNIFEFTDDRYCQSGEHCHLISELQHHTTAVLRRLSEDPSCISLLVQSGFLLKCFDSLYSIAKYEIACSNNSAGESQGCRRNIKFWYRQSQREIAKCLGNITSCPTVDSVEALRKGGVDNSKLTDWCELTSHFSCESVRTDAKRFIPVY